MKRLAFAVAAACAVVLVSPRVRADDAAGLRSFEEGRRLFEGRRYDEALRAFRASYEAAPSPNSRLYVARCLHKLGKVASAYSAFRLASREAEDRVRATGEKRYAATQQSAAFEARMLEALVPRLSLRIDSARPRDAERAVLHVDGEPLPRAAWATPLELDPGAHTILVTGPYIVRREIAVTVGEREAKELVVAIERQASGTVRIVFKTRPTGLAVELDGVPLDVSPTAPSLAVDVGAHTLVAHAPGYASTKWEGDVTDEASVQVSVELAPLAGEASQFSVAPREAPPGPPKWLFFATAATAVASAGLGAYLVLEARAGDRAEQEKAASDRDPARRDDLKERAQIGSVMLIAGGGLAVAAGVLGLTTRWRPGPRTGVAFAPQLDVGRVGLAGEF